MLIGYARISTHDQRFDLQVNALQAAGCAKIFSDTQSGTIDDRKGLAEALEFLQAGHTLVVWRLDRLGRSLQHLVNTMTILDSKGVGFRSLTESLGTDSPGGRLIFHLFASLAQFEGDLIRARTRAGLEAARARNKIGGRPSKLDPQKIATAKRLLADPSMRVEDVCVGLGISKSTLYRALQASRT